MLHIKPLNKSRSNISRISVNSFLFNNPLTATFNWLLIDIGGINLLPLLNFGYCFKLLSQVSTCRSVKHGGISISPIQRSVFRGFIDFCLTCCTALTLRGLLSAGDNMLELNGVSSPDHLSLILISLPLTFYHCMCGFVYLALFTLSSCCSSTLTFPSISPLNPPLPAPSLVIQLLRQEQCPRLAWPLTLAHQAFLMLLHSAAAAAVAAVSSFPLSPLWLCLLLLSPGVVSLPSGPLWSGEPQRLQPNPWWLGDIFKRWC